MHCWNPWTYKCSNHALPKYRDNRNRKWQIVKARLYFELGHKLRQTAAINYGVRHSSQVAYNSSRAIFDLFSYAVAMMNSFSFVEVNMWQVWQLILIARRGHGTIFTREIKTFSSKGNHWRPWKILKCCFSTQPLVWFPNPLAAGSQRDGDPVYSAPHRQAQFML